MLTKTKLDRQISLINLAIISMCIKTSPESPITCVCFVFPFALMRVCMSMALIGYCLGRVGLLNVSFNLLAFIIEGFTL